MAKLLHGLTQCRGCKSTAPQEKASTPVRRSQGPAAGGREPSKPMSLNNGNWSICPGDGLQLPVNL